MELAPGIVASVIAGPFAGDEVMVIERPRNKLVHTPSDSTKAGATTPYMSGAERGLRWRHILAGMQTLTLGGPESDDKWRFCIMALDFTIVANVRNQFGDSDLDIGVFAGREKRWTFGCPSVSSDQALLLFQSLGVRGEQVLDINDVPVFGGVPSTDAFGVTSFDGDPRHMA